VKKGGGSLWVLRWPAWAEWQYVLPELAPGVHQLDTRMWPDHSLIDGIDWDGDGRPDPFTPKGATRHTVITITVVPAGT